MLPVCHKIMEITAGGTRKQTGQDNSKGKRHGKAIGKEIDRT